MFVGIIFVVFFFELYGFGSWFLNFDRRNCRFQFKNKIDEIKDKVICIENFILKKVFFSI